MAARGPFNRSTLDKARTFLAAEYQSGRIVRGRGAFAASDLSAAQAIRYANVAARTPGAITLQSARRGPEFTARARAEQVQAAARGKRIPQGLEHPRGRWVGPTKRVRGRDVPDLDAGSGYYADQRRQRAGGLRQLQRIGAERVSILAYGTLAAGYGGDAGKGWRVLFTGPRDQAIREWPAIGAGVHGRDGMPGAGVPMFERVEKFEIRSGPYYGD